MMHPISHEELEAAARALISARKTNLGIEVSMPVIYPSGKAVTVVVTVEGNEYIVHDAGYGAMYLTDSGVNLTKQLTKRLVSLAAHYGCDFIENRMTRRCSVEQVALATAMVANASRTIGDQTLEVRRRLEHDFSEAVSQRLREAVGSRVRPHHEIEGASGRRYRVGNIVLDQAEKVPVAFIESFANRANVPSHFMEFFDLKPQYPNTERLSVYDENEQFPQADLNLLSKVSDVVSYQQSRSRFAALSAR